MSQQRHAPGYVMASRAAHPRDPAVRHVGPDARLDVCLLPGEQLSGPGLKVQEEEKVHPAGGNVKMCARCG